jgi:hypothetical protein
LIPKLKAPGTKHLKLEFDELLSSFAFKFSLRRYMMVRALRRQFVPEEHFAVQEVEAGAYTPPLLSST